MITTSYALLDSDVRVDYNKFKTSLDRVDKALSDFAAKEWKVKLNTSALDSAISKVVTLGADLKALGNITIKASVQGSGLNKVADDADKAANRAAKLERIILGIENRLVKVGLGNEFQKLGNIDWKNLEQVRLEVDEIISAETRLQNTLKGTAAVADRSNTANIQGLRVINGATQEQIKLGGAWTKEIEGVGRAMKKVVAQAASYAQHTPSLGLSTRVMDTRALKDQQFLGAGWAKEIENNAKLAGTAVDRFGNTVGDTFRRGAKDAGYFHESLLNVMNTIRRFVVGYLAVRGLIFIFQQLKESVIDFNQTMQSQLIAITALLHGNQAAAKGLLEQLQLFAIRTPFQFKELTELAPRLMAAHIAAKDIIPTLQALGDVAAVKGGAMHDTISNLATDFLALSARGKVTGIDIRQFGSSGVNIVTLLAKAYSEILPKGTKQAEAAMRDMIHKGLIPADVAIKAIVNGIERSDIGGLMDKQSKTFVVALSNVKDALDRALGKATETQFKALTDRINDLSKLMLDPNFQKWADSMVQNLNRVGTLAVWVAGQFRLIETAVLALGIRLIWLRGAAVVGALVSAWTNGVIAMQISFTGFTLTTVRNLAIIATTGAGAFSIMGKASTIFFAAYATNLFHTRDATNDVFSSMAIGAARYYDMIAKFRGVEGGFERDTRRTLDAIGHDAKESLKMVFGDFDALNQAIADLKKNQADIARDVPVPFKTTETNNPNKPDSNLRKVYEQLLDSQRKFFEEQKRNWESFGGAVDNLVDKIRGFGERSEWAALRAKNFGQTIKDSAVVAAEGLAKIVDKMREITTGRDAVIQVFQRMQEKALEMGASPERFAQLQAIVRRVQAMVDPRQALEGMAKNAEGLNAQIRREIDLNIKTLNIEIANIGTLKTNAQTAQTGPAALSSRGGYPPRAGLLDAGGGAVPQTNLPPGYRGGSPRDALPNIPSPNLPMGIPSLKAALEKARMKALESTNKVARAFESPSFVAQWIFGSPMFGMPEKTGFNDEEWKAIASTADPKISKFMKGLSGKQELGLQGGLQEVGGLLDVIDLEAGLKRLQVQTKNYISTQKEEQTMLLALREAMLKYGYETEKTSEIEARLREITRIKTDADYLKAAELDKRNNTGEAGKILAQQLAEYDATQANVKGNKILAEALKNTQNTIDAVAKAWDEAGDKLNKWRESLRISTTEQQSQIGTLQQELKLTQLSGDSRERYTQGLEKAAAARREDNAYWAAWKAAVAAGATATNALKAAQDAFSLQKMIEELRLGIKTTEAFNASLAKAAEMEADAAAMLDNWFSDYNNKVGQDVTRRSEIMGEIGDRAKFRLMPEGVDKEVARVTLQWGRLNSAVDASKPLFNAVELAAAAAAFRIDYLAEQSTQRWNQFASDFAGAVTSAITSTGSLIQNLLKNVADMLQQAAAQIASNWIIGQILGLAGVPYQQPAMGGLAGLIMGGFGHKSHGPTAAAVDIPNYHVGYASGTDYVPHTGTYLLHQGERVVTAAENRSYNQGGDTYNITVHVPPGADGRRIGNEIRQALSRPSTTSAQKAGANWINGGNRNL